MTTTAATEKSAHFELVTGASRADLASRREVKYAIENADVGKLRRLLEGNCRRLIHNHPVSVVRSIYFDDAQLSACHANLNGLGSRRKLRLRWYDSLQPPADFFFEIKWRENLNTGKHRFQLRAQQSLAVLSYKEIRRGLEPVVPLQLVPAFVKYSEPILIVQYKREHFAAGDGLRITLDYDITYYDQTGRQTIATSFPRRLSGLAVLEGKTPMGRANELRRWIHPFSPRVGRCSKYVHGCCQLGLIHEIAQ